MPKKLTNTVNSTAKTLTFKQNSQNLFIFSSMAAPIADKHKIA
jgi:hypothetical protein